MQVEYLFMKANVNPKLYKTQNLYLLPFDVHIKT